MLACGSDGGDFKAAVTDGGVRQRATYDTTTREASHGVWLVTRGDLWRRYGELVGRRWQQVAERPPAEETNRRRDAEGELLGDR